MKRNTPVVYILSLLIYIQNASHKKRIHIGSVTLNSVFPRPLDSCSTSLSLDSDEYPLLSLLLLEDSFPPLRLVEEDLSAPLFRDDLRLSEDEDDDEESFQMVIKKYAIVATMTMPPKTYAYPR